MLGLKLNHVIKSGHRSKAAKTPTVYSDADQRKHQSSKSLAFVWGIHRDRWIPRTKGQLRGKCFHLMTSSWLCEMFNWFLPLKRKTISCRATGFDVCSVPIVVGIASQNSDSKVIQMALNNAAATYCWEGAVGTRALSNLISSLSLPLYTHRRQNERQLCLGPCL